MTLTASKQAHAVHEVRLKNGALRTTEIITEVTQKINARRAPQTETKTAADKRRMGEVVIDSKLVKRYLTTLDQLEKRGQLPKHLKMAFDRFAEAVAVASGACVFDGDPRGSSARTISVLDSADGAQFGSRTLSNSVIAASYLERQLWGTIPEDLRKLADQLVHEETGYSATAPKPLTAYGHENAFQQEQQARAVGATMAVDICRIIHHALKSHDL